jgi:hypothetical protein
MISSLFDSAHWPVSESLSLTDDVRGGSGTGRRDGGVVWQEGGEEG